MIGIRLDLLVILFCMLNNLQNENNLNPNRPTQAKYPGRTTASKKSYNTQTYESIPFPLVVHTQTSIPEHKEILVSQSSLATWTLPERHDVKVPALSFTS